MKQIGKVEIRDDKGPGWTKSVFIDDEQLRLQVCENPTIEGNICIVRCITDRHLSTPLDPDTVPYQVKPYLKGKGDKATRTEGREVTTFYLKYP